MRNKVKIALIQMDCEFGNVESNVNKAERFIRKSNDKNAKIICLPESFNVGYSLDRVDEMMSMGETLDGETIGRMKTVAKELGVYIIAPIILNVAPGIYRNTAVFISDDGGIAGHYTKTHMIGEERLYFKRGSDYPVFETKYGKIGIQICYDMVFAEATRLLALKGAELIFYPSAWRDKLNYKLMWENNLVGRAIDNVLFVAGVNRSGEIDGVHFSGESMVVNPNGDILGKCDDKEDILFANIDFNQIAKERSVNFAMIYRHPEDYGPLTEL